MTHWMTRCPAELFYLRLCFFYATSESLPLWVLYLNFQILETVVRDCVFMWVFVWMCVCLCAFVCVCAQARACVCVCLCVYVCAWVCVHECVCTCLCVRVRDLYVTYTCVFPARPPESIVSVSASDAIRFSPATAAALMHRVGSWPIRYCSHIMRIVSGKYRNHSRDSCCHIFHLLCGCEL